MSDDDRESRGAEERIDLSNLGRLSDRPPPPKGENAVRVARALSVLLLAIAAAGLPWYFVARGGGKDEKAAPPTSSPTTSRPSPSPTPTRSSYEVYNVEKCANFRAQPTTGSARIGQKCLVPGIRLTSDGQTKDAEGRLWRRVYDSLPKVWGWMADEYLKPVG